MKAILFSVFLTLTALPSAQAYDCYFGGGNGATTIDFKVVGSEIIADVQSRSQNGGGSMFNDKVFREARNGQIIFVSKKPGLFKLVISQTRSDFFKNYLKGKMVTKMSFGKYEQSIDCKNDL